jgi:Domain of unknown function (DUF1906)
MAFGLDYSMGMPPIADMKAAGVAFACRYVGYFSGYDDTHPERSQGKCLTPGEAQTLSQAGIALVSNYEWYESRPTEGFASGAWDAQEAQKIHLACGGPRDRPIYFSVDEGIDGSLTANYFKGVASGIGLQRTGAYGDDQVLAYLFDNHLITWGWQTYAWSGGAWEPRAHIQQYSNSVNMGGVQVDYDRSMQADYGQWFVGGNMVPQGWTDANNVLTAPNGVKVVHGFRDWVLSHNWDPANWPLGAEFGTSLLEASNPSLGGGSQQLFRWSMLGYTAARGVFNEWLGQELAFCRQQVQQKAAQITQLQAELAAAQQPTVQGVDPAKVKDRLTAIGLAANNGNTAIQQLVNQPL